METQNTTQDKNNDGGQATANADIPPGASALNKPRVTLLARLLAVWMSVFRRSATSEIARAHSLTSEYSDDQWWVELSESLNWSLKCFHKWREYPKVPHSERKHYDHRGYDIYGQAVEPIKYTRPEAASAFRDIAHRIQRIRSVMSPRLLFIDRLSRSSLRSATLGWVTGGAGSAHIRMRLLLILAFGLGYALSVVDTSDEVLAWLVTAPALLGLTSTNPGWCPDCGLNYPDGDDEAPCVSCDYAKENWATPEFYDWFDFVPRDFMGDLHPITSLNEYNRYNEDANFLSWMAAQISTRDILSKMVERRYSLFREWADKYHPEFDYLEALVEGALSKLDHGDEFARLRLKGDAHIMMMQATLDFELPLQLQPSFRYVCHSSNGIDTRPLVRLIKMANLLHDYDSIRVPPLDPVGSLETRVCDQLEAYWGTEHESLADWLILDSDGVLAYTGQLRHDQRAYLDDHFRTYILLECVGRYVDFLLAKQNRLVDAVSGIPAFRQGASASTVSGMDYHRAWTRFADAYLSIDMYPIHEHQNLTLAYVLQHLKVASLRGFRACTEMGSVCNGGNHFAQWSGEDE